MAMRCDVRRHLVQRGGEENKEILDERFQQCSTERAVIVDCEHGRVGVCKEHVKEYSEYRKLNEGKPTKARKPWARLRRGVIIMGEERELTQKS